jgi:hypothetical protein
VSVYSDMRQIRAEALRLDPVRFLLAILAAPFAVLGVVLRLVWMVPAFCYASTVYGWRKADAAVKASQAPQ